MGTIDGRSLAPREIEAFYGSRPRFRLTPEGRDRLKEELEYLRHTKMPELTTRIQDANEHGDISDNSEYEDLKEEVVMTDARVTNWSSCSKQPKSSRPPPVGRSGSARR